MLQHNFCCTHNRSARKTGTHFYFSWLGCSPLILEQKILQFSAALFIIEKFADYSEEAGFTQVRNGSVT